MFFKLLLHELTSIEPSYKTCSAATKVNVSERKRQKQVIKMK